MFKCVYSNVSAEMTINMELDKNNNSPLYNHRDKKYICREMVADGRHLSTIKIYILKSIFDRFPFLLFLLDKYFKEHLFLKGKVAMVNSYSGHGN